MPPPIYVLSVRFIVILSSRSSAYLVMYIRMKALTLAIIRPLRSTEHTFRNTEYSWERSSNAQQWPSLNRLS